jgi:hypothetical protein
MKNFSNKEIALSLYEQCQRMARRFTDSGRYISIMDFGEIKYHEIYSPEKSINAAYEIYRHLERTFNDLAKDYRVHITVAGGRGDIYIGIYQGDNPDLSEEMIPKIEGFRMKYTGNRVEYRPLPDKQ